MNHFTQYTPSFVDVGDPKLVPFNTTEELLDIGVVKRCRDNPYFSHYALNGNMIMEIADSGKMWWVIGYVDHPENVDLPQWE